MDSLDVVFILSSLLCLVSACAIVTRKNPVYSVVCMLPFFIGMTILFVLLSAPFLAAMQMMVYGGAILVVFLFVIMLINLRPEDLRDDFSLQTYAPPAIVGGMLGGLILSFVRHGIPEGSALQKAFEAPITTDRTLHVFGLGGRAPALGSIDSIAVPLFKQYVVPFELVSLLIVVAVLGAVILAKKRV